MERPSRREREGGERSARALWTPPLALSILLVAAAPFVSELRKALAERLGRDFLYVLTATLVVATVVILSVALRRALRRDGWRYRLGSRLSALALAVALVALEVTYWTTGDRSADAVERVHLLEYALLAVLYQRALGARFAGLGRWVLSLEAVAFVGLADETVQWLTPVRVGDGRDLLLNVYAGLIGVVLAWALAPADARPTPGWRWGPGTGRRSGPRLAALAGAVLVVAAGTFFDAVHLGHEIDDPVLGTFRSSFSPAGLARAGRERTARWAVRSPEPLRPLAVEDDFLTEAGWHAQVRNAAVDRGDLVQAWRENRILERWYRPFLELPRRRWPAAQRAWTESRLEAEHPRALGPSPGYRSPALAGRIVVAPPRPLLWLGIAAAAAWLLALGVKCAPAAPAPPGNPPRGTA